MIDETERNRTEVTAEAERAFEEFLDRRYAGEEIDLERLCAEQPALAEELKRLHGQYEAFRRHESGAGAIAGDLDVPAVSPSFFHRWGPGGDESADSRGSPSRLEKGAILGEFQLVRRLGRGAMGEVWLAAQRSVGNRPVALKFVRPELLGERTLAYFRREVRATGRLAHPGLVTIHDAYEAEGLAWISMEYVEDGLTLHDFLKRAPKEGPEIAELDREAARLIARVADAMQAAHDAGVIHRDLKPTNILIDAGSRPRVADFGLARIAEESTLTAEHGFAGTVAYASPEQLRGRDAPVDHRSDIYSLGLILFELLTRRRPFEAQAYAELVALVTRIDAPDPRTFRKTISPDLSKIVGKALRRDPELRYPRMDELATDLRSFLAGELIETRFLPAITSSGDDCPLRSGLLASWWIDVPCLLHRRNSRLRVACPVFLRLGASDRFFLVRVPGEGLENDFLPIGGVLKHAGGEELAAMGFAPDSLAWIDPAELLGDIRGCLARKHLPRFRRWVHSGRDRESDPDGLRREILEELTRIGLEEVVELVDGLVLRAVWCFEQPPTPTPGRRYRYQYRRTTVLEPDPENPHGEALRRRLIDAEPTNPHLILASPDEIRRGRTRDGEPIAHNAPYLLGELRRPGEPGGV